MIMWLLVTLRHNIQFIIPYVLYNTEEFPFKIFIMNIGTITNTDKTAVSNSGAT